MNRIGPEDLLQERLERLESGDALEDCLTGAPEDIMDSLKAADRLMSLEWPERSPEQVAAQRAGLVEAPDLLKTLDKELSMESQNKNQKPDWKHNSRLPLTFAAALVVLACIFTSVIGGSLWAADRFGQNVADRSPQIAEKSDVVVKNPENAVLSEVYGLVEVQNEAGEWTLASPGDTLSAGARLRLGELSSARLVFYDGSQVLLGPNSEIAIDELGAGSGDDTRVVVLSQAVGASEHIVTSSPNPSSRYEVRTSAATGSATGTQFKVLVMPDQEAYFSVSEGEIAVSGQDVTVPVGSGQATVASLDLPPTEPGSFFTGRGEVNYIGDNWVIDGQSMMTHPGTVIIGDPQVGDFVFYEGRLLPDDTRLVDLIVLLRRNPANRFSLTGIAETIGDTSWTVNGQQIAITEATVIEDGIVQGDLVRVEGVILAGGALQAEVIRGMEEPPGLPFDFTGIVQQTGDLTWLISGRTIAITDTTTISPGLVVGDLVRVIGWILEDGTWEASAILRALDESRAFDFTGAIESIDPWVVAGIPFQTNEWTDIDEGLVVGDQVRVTGQIMENGTWIAYEIHRLEDPFAPRIFLVGIVESIDPWVVSGVALNVDEETVIVGEIQVGMLVRVEIQALPDGSWKILEIAPLQGFFWGVGCRQVTAVVIGVSGNQIQLEGWPAMTLGEDVQLPGELMPQSVVIVTICFGEDGLPVVVAIIIILEPGIIEPPDDEIPGEKVMICHKPSGKNPHTIVVSQSAVPAHLGHGDYLGACP